MFGFAQAFESAAAPITAFLIAPIAEFIIIPSMATDAGRATWSWLLGAGEARGIALVFLVAGLVMVVFALLAFLTRSYCRISATNADQQESVMPDEVVTGSSDSFVGRVDVGHTVVVRVDSVLFADLAVPAVSRGEDDGGQCRSEH